MIEADCGAERLGQPALTFVMQRENLSALNYSSVWLHFRPDRKLKAADHTAAFEESATKQQMNGRGGGNTLPNPKRTSGSLLLRRMARATAKSGASHDRVSSALSGDRLSLFSRSHFFRAGRGEGEGVGTTVLVFIKGKQKVFSVPGRFHKDTHSMLLCPRRVPAARGDFLLPAL